jgi:hypothetical protein
MESPYYICLVNEILQSGQRDVKDPVVILGVRHPQSAPSFIIMPSRGVINSVMDLRRHEIEDVLGSYSIGTQLDSITFQARRQLRRQLAGGGATNAGIYAE